MSNQTASPEKSIKSYDTALLTGSGRQEQAKNEEIIMEAVKEVLMEENNLDLGRRKHMRVGVDAYISATLTTDKDNAERIFTTKNMSPEGIFLVSNESFPVGTILNLMIHTPSTMEPINAQARVARIAKDENLNTVGMGLIFIEMSEDVKKELLKHLYLAYHYTGNK